MYIIRSRREGKPGTRGTKNRKKILFVFRVRWLRYCGCARYLPRGIAYANGAIDDRADKGTYVSIRAYFIHLTFPARRPQGARAGWRSVSNR
jgi:hypothetical protein